MGVAPRFRTRLPSPRRRMIVPWLALLFHGALFAAAMFAYPTWSATNRQLVVNNQLPLLVIGWLGALLVHLALTLALEIRDGLRQAQIERLRRQAYQEV